MAGRFARKYWIVCGNTPRMKSPITPSPSMIACNQFSPTSQPAYSSDMLRTAIVRKDAMNSPIMPMPIHIAGVRDVRERLSQSARRGGKPASNGNPLVESDARINPTPANGICLSIPRTSLKCIDFERSLKIVSERDQTAKLRARAGKSKNKMGIPSLVSRLSASSEKPVSAMEP